MQPTVRIRRDPATLAPLATAGPTGFNPAALRQAYGFDTLMLGNGALADGSGQTVVIVDAYDNPKFVSSSDPNYNTSDLYKFNAEFGLPQFGAPGGPTFTKVNQTGGTSYPATDTGWGTEIALDVEWVHALAPGANIVLVEANSNSYSNLLTAGVGWARNQSGVSVVSMSFGGSEFFGETSYDSVFTTPAGHNGITFVASTGDNGKPGGYPAYSPNVLAVGGTSLTLAGGNYLSESGWSGSGGGISNNQGKEPKPSYQSSITLSSNRRMIPDVSMVADPNTGVGVYDSFGQGVSAPWLQVGGTSLSAPLWGALIAITNQVRGVAGLPTLNGRNDTLPGLYAMPASNFHDIIAGSNGYSATAGYDLVTGLGTPRVASIVGDFVGAAPGTPDLPALYDSGANNADNITNLSTLHFTGAAASGLMVQIAVDGAVVGSAATVGGSYDISVAGLTDGQHLITARIGTRVSGGLSITIDTVAPAMIDSAFTYQSGLGVQFKFSEDVSASLSAASLSVVPDGGLGALVVDSPLYSVAANAVTFALSSSTPDGDYIATLLPAGVTDLAGNALTTPGVVNFFILPGDANRDRTVNAADLGILSLNWQGTGKTFSQGDFNADGVVDLRDLYILSSRWRQTLPPPPPATTPLALSLQTPTRTATRMVSLIS
jgi:hypothetical protein